MASTIIAPERKRVSLSPVGSVSNSDEERPEKKFRSMYPKGMHEDLPALLFLLKTTANTKVLKELASIMDKVTVEAFVHAGGFQDLVVKANMNIHSKSYVKLALDLLVKCHDENPVIVAKLSPIQVALDVIKAFHDSQDVVTLALQVWSKFIPPLLERGYVLTPSNFQQVVRLSVQSMKKFDENHEIQVYALRVLSSIAKSRGALRSVLEASGVTLILGKNLNRYSGKTSGWEAVLYRQSNLALWNILSLLPSDKEKRGSRVH